MATELRLTITEVAASIERQFGRLIPVWKLRRVVDALESQESLDVQRIASYRTVAAVDVGVIAAELRQLGWLESEVAACN
ncbi:MAG: hypothetical protein IAG10_24345 [Planctomycetaceae bacterium]|nr:hypothetical protein [Planctomycetaceae bacterium]